MRVAVIGACGWAGQRHLAAFRALEASVTHLVDHSPQCAEAAREIGAEAVADYRDILDIKLDGVSIALPPSEQPEISKAFLQRGVSVLCEKPVAMNAAQAQDVCDFVRRMPDALFMPGFLLRFHPTYLRIRDIIRSGDLGRIHELRIDGRVKKGSVTGWRLDQGMGGVALVNAIHAFDLARWLVGELDQPAFSTIGNRHFDIPTEDWMDCILYSETGVRVQIRSGWWPFLEQDFCSLDMEGWILRVRLEGERGALVQTHDGYLHVDAAGTTPVKTAAMPDLFASEVAYFLDCVKNKTASQITADDNLAAQSLVEQCKARAVPEPVRTAAE